MKKSRGITCCDTTDHGGRVLEGYATMRHKGHRVAGKGHKVFCPRCNGVFPIVESLSPALGYALAVEGMRTGCGARLIASQDDLWFDDASDPAPSLSAPDTSASNATQSETRPIALSHGNATASTATSPVVVTSPLPDATHVVFRIGLFNDGTGNNYPNSRAAMERCTPQAIDLDKHPGVLEQLMSACRKREGVDGISYAGGETNVHRLWDMYAETISPDEIVTGNDGRKYIYRRAYIEGIGTTAEHPDSLYASALGWGPSGVIARAEEAVTKAASEIAAFIKANSDTPLVIDAVELDLFGFSRGATASRHVASLVLHAGDEGVMARTLRERHLPFKPGWNGGSRSDLRIRFIGLFDSVAAIGIPNNNDNDPVKLYLAEDCADQVFHLTARDECRENFALNRVMTGRHREVAVPGVHSDIGGGYHMRAMEQVILTEPQVSIEKLDNTRYREWAEFTQRYGNSQALDAYLNEVARNSAAWNRTLQQTMNAPRLRKEWLIDPELNPPPNADNYKIQYWYKVVGDPRQRFRGAVTDVALQVTAALVALRQVRGEYQSVTLRVMHAASQRAGVPYSKSPDDVPELMLPTELTPITTKLLAQITEAGNNSQPLSEEEEQRLSRRYLHQSAHWNPGEWKPVYEALPDGAARATLPTLWGADLRIVFPMRPADRRARLIFDQKKGH